MPPGGTRDGCADVYPVHRPWVTPSRTPTPTAPNTGANASSAAFTAFHVADHGRAPRMLSEAPAVAPPATSDTLDS